MPGVIVAVGSRLAPAARRAAIISTHCHTAVLGRARSSDVGFARGVISAAVAAWARLSQGAATTACRRSSVVTAPQRHTHSGAIAPARRRVARRRAARSPSSSRRSAELASAPARRAASGDDLGAPLSLGAEDAGVVARLIRHEGLGDRVGLAAGGQAHLGEEHVVEVDLGTGQSKNDAQRIPTAHLYMRQCVQ